MESCSLPMTALFFWGGFEIFNLCNEEWLHFLIDCDSYNGPLSFQELERQKHTCTVLQHKQVELKEGIRQRDELIEVCLH